ncbi:MAG: transposase [Rhodobacteraceae bacterium]|nr:transposase [Paracoccaceae bacterium]
MTIQSDRWRGRAFIQRGHKPLRDALYMPALVAIRFNSDLNARYDRMNLLENPQSRNHRRHAKTPDPHKYPCQREPRIERNQTLIKSDTLAMFPADQPPNCSR